MTEKELVELAKKGDESAITKIVRDNSDRLYTLLVRLLRNEQEAQDALQETFITMFKKISTFGGKSSLFTWLYRIATNVALMKLRSRQKIDELDIDDSKISDDVHSGAMASFPSQPDFELHRKETKQALDEAIGNLPAKYRSVFILRDIEQLPIVEASKILNISEENVKTRLRRARIFLRNELAERLAL
jgi:RNA polymerase sigma-70 factor (ECF subfamily)